MLYKRNLLFCFLLLLAGSLYAQDQLELGAIYSIKVHTPDKPLRGYAFGTEFAFNFDMANNKADYVRLLNIKSIDLAGSYRNFQYVSLKVQPPQDLRLGSAYSLLGRLDIQIFKFSKTQLFFCPAFGFSYVSQTFFTNGNPLIGSHLNLGAQLGFKVSTPLSNTFAIKAGADIFHFSNVAYFTPNYGVNSNSISLSLVKILPTTLIKNDYAIQDYAKNSLELSVDIGRRGASRSNKGYYKSGLYAGYSYRLSTLISLKTGLDAIYYHSVFDPNHVEETSQGYGTSYDRWRTGLNAGVDIWLGHFAILGDYGYYLHFKSTYPTKWYWNAGLKYHVRPWLAVQGKAYINHTQADVLGLGLLFKVR